MTSRSVKGETMGSPTISERANDFTVDFNRRIGERLTAVFATERARLRSEGIPIVSVVIGVNLPTAPLLHCSTANCAMRDDFQPCSTTPSGATPRLSCFTVAPGARTATSLSRTTRGCCCPARSNAVSALSPSAPGRRPQRTFRSPRAPSNSRLSPIRALLGGCPRNSRRT